MFKKNNEDQTLTMQSRLSRGRARQYSVAMFLSFLVLLTLVLGVYAGPVPNGSVTPLAWSPDSGRWEGGNPDGFAEGQTVPIVVYLVPGTAGSTYDMNVCLQVEEGNPPYDYGFIGFEKWDKTVKPPRLPNQNPGVGVLNTPDYSNSSWDTSKAPIYGYRVTINTTTGPSRDSTGSGICDPEYVGYTINFTVLSTASTPPTGEPAGAWILFGGRFAQAGDLIPTPNLDSNVTNVPADHGANAINNVFQLRLGTDSADKTVNFKGGTNITESTNLSITKSCPDFSVLNSGGYTITVTNNGPLPAENPIITDDLVGLLGGTDPPLSLAVSNPPSITSQVNGGNAGTCELDSFKLKCYLDPQYTQLETTQTWIVTIQVKINDGVKSGTNIGNVAYIYSPTDGSTKEDTNADGKGSTTATTCTTPVSLSYFKTTEIGERIRFDWSTATESGNLGFNILAVTDEGTVQLNEELIPSKTISSVDNQDYSLTVGNVDADTFLIQSVDVRGMVEQRGAYQLGEVYGQRLEPDLIDWGAIRAESEIKASLRQGALLGDPVENSARPARKSNSLTAADTASAVNLTIDEDGLYRVSFLRLKNAGLDLHTVPANEIALTNQGQSVPVYVGDGFIEFYGEALDTLYTADNVYTVQVDAALAKQVLQNYQTPRRKATPAEYYMETLIFDENKVMMDYISSTDPWINSYLFTQSGTVSQSYPFSGVDNYLAGLAPVNFTADLWGGYRNKQHNVQSELNGTLLAEKSFSGVQKYVVETELPEGVLQNGENTFTVTAGNGERELVFFDKLSIAYPRAFVARDGQLTFTEKGEVFAVNNLRSRDVIVYRISDNMTERMMSLKRRGTGHETYSATFSGKSSEAKYVVADAAAIKTPVAIIKADPQVDISSGSVNTLIIAHPDFIGTDLDRLADTRRAQGYSVKIVDVNQVYVQYGDNIFDAQAIKKYLTHALENMDVQMVLLVGGDTYDYRNYIGNSISFIPSLYAQTDDLIKFAPVDPWYVDPDGDKVPNAVIGRLPVRNSIELSNLVEKTETYIANGYTSTAVFSADTNYTYDSIELAGMMPEGWSVAKANIGEVGVDAARETLISSINEGVALASYFGHSADDQWSFEGLFTLNDAIALNNVGKPTVVTQYGCWNTYYVAPKANTLGHKLLLGENGAAAVTGATTLTSAVSEAKLGELMMPALVSGKTIGEAMLESKEALALTDPGLIDVQLGWTILGIPWLEVK
jgi:hypothetical protein